MTRVENAGFASIKHVHNLENLVTERRKPVMLVECKWADDDVNKTLRHLKQRFPQAAAWQVHCTGKKDFMTPDGIRVAPALTLLSELV